MTNNTIKIVNQITANPKLFIEDKWLFEFIIKLPNEYIGFSGAIIPKSNLSVPCVPIFRPKESFRPFLE